MKRSTEFPIPNSQSRILHRSAFTLVELLVVITIIGMLMALLLPAVQAAREMGRRAACFNNQHQLALAMQNFESTRRYFPGYVNTVGTRAASWIVPLLPYMGRKELYDNWVGGTPSAVYLKLLICPSDPPDTNNLGDTWMAYMCNVGRNDASNSYTALANMPEGVCFDQTVAAPIRLGADYISNHDGTTTTLLLAESVLKNPVTPPKLNLGTANGDRPNPKWAYTVQTSPAPIATEFPVDFGFNWSGTFTGVSDKILSRHTGGCVVSFCDGHQAFLRDSVNVMVYKHLMTPWGEGCTPKLSTLSADPKMQFLDESSL